MDAEEVWNKSDIVMKVSINDHESMIQSSPAHR